MDTAQSRELVIFALPIAAGLAPLIWPEHRWIAKWTFGAAVLIAVLGLNFWAQPMSFFKPNYVIGLGLVLTVGGFIWQQTRSAPSAQTTSPPVSGVSSGQAAPQQRAASQSLSDRVVKFLAARGKSVRESGAAPSMTMHDDSDGTGPYIAEWDQDALGSWPTEKDGFSREELRKAPLVLLSPRRFASSELDQMLSALQRLRAIHEQDAVPALHKAGSIVHGAPRDDRFGRLDIARVSERARETAQALTTIDDKLRAVISESANAPFRSELEPVIKKYGSANEVAESLSKIADVATELDKAKNTGINVLLFLEPTLLQSIAPLSRLAGRTEALAAAISFRTNELRDWKNP